VSRVRRPLVIIALGMGSLTLAACAPLVESMTIDEWTSSLPGVLTMGTSGMVDPAQPFEVELGSLGRGSHEVLLDCRSREPVEMTVGDRDPVVVECGATTSVPVEVERTMETLRIRATATADAWISARVPQQDAFVDGEPVEP